MERMRWQQEELELLARREAEALEEQRRRQEEEALMEQQREEAARVMREYLHQISAQMQQLDAAQMDHREALQRQEHHDFCALHAEFSASFSIVQQQEQVRARWIAWSETEAPGDLCRAQGSF